MPVELPNNPATLGPGGKLKGRSQLLGAHVESSGGETSQRRRGGSSSAFYPEG